MKQKHYIVRLHDGSERVVAAKAYRVEDTQRAYVFVGDDDKEDQFVPLTSVAWIIVQKEPSTEQSEQQTEIQAEIHREHGLLSNRMNWYVTSQAFLVGAFAVSGNANYTLQSMSQLIPYIGIGVTVVIMISILGGLLAMHRLRKKVSFNCHGAPRWFHWCGVAPLWMMPLVFLAVWTLGLHLRRVP